jgi:hypothetical protein
MMKYFTYRLASILLTMVLLQNVYASDLEHITMDVIDIDTESVEEVMHQIEIPDMDDRDAHEVNRNEIEDSTQEKDDSSEEAEDSKEETAEAKEEAEDAKDESEDSKDEAEESKEESRDEASEVENEVELPE